MKKYEIYLPLKYNDGKEIEPGKIKRIREELIAVFGAITVSSQSAPYQGSWKYGGVNFIDDIIKIEIITNKIIFSALFMSLLLQSDLLLCFPAAVLTVRLMPRADFGELSRAVHGVPSA
jgi:hypothetical protein